MTALDAGRDTDDTVTAPGTRASPRSLNLAHAATLIAAITAVPAIAGWASAGMAGATAAAGFVLLALALADRLRPEAAMRIYGARRIAQGHAGQIELLSAEIARRAGLARPPALFVLPSLAITAYATGNRRRSAIALTEGLLRGLTMRETAGVLAHEMAHIRAGDAHLFTLADVVSRLAQVVCYAGIALAVINSFGSLTDEAYVRWWVVGMLYLTPALLSLLQATLSRMREFEADGAAAALTGDAIGLAAAVRRMDASLGHAWEDLMLPVPVRRVPTPSLLRAGPEPAARIERLLAPGAERHADFAPLRLTEEPMLLLTGFGPGDMRARYRFPGVWY